MSKFAAANVSERRQILEDALAKALRPIGEIMHNSDGERVFAVWVQTGPYTSEWQTKPLWKLAQEIEADLQ